MTSKILSLFLFFPLFSIAQNQETRTINYGGEIREYIIYVPSIYSSSNPTPLMFSFHGGGGDGQGMIGFNDMRPLADTANFIAIYPSGADGAWMHKVPTPYNDIYFVEAIIDALISDFNVDSERIYACGYSEGGIFTYELACRLSSRIAAVASVSGSMITDTYRSDPDPDGYGFPVCSPSHPTAIMFIPGTVDMNPNSMYNGLSPYYMSASEISTYWSSQNNANMSPIVNPVPDVNASDGSTVERSVWEDGDNCVRVEELKVIGGDHEWPGSFGNMDISATNEIWNFVSKFDINGLIGCNSTNTTNSYEIVDFQNRNVLEITDILGRKTNELKNVPLLYHYDDGTVEQKIILE
ncbi:MAG TPA: hypothetical protein DCF84_03720 [Bacteroidetes bacterium]|nr:hypothetical protein [Bacteroidota bacterium]